MHSPDDPEPERAVRSSEFNDEPLDAPKSEPGRLQPDRPTDADTPLEDGGLPARPVGRRLALALVGLGLLALSPGRATAQSSPGNQPFTNWQADVDANGHDLVNLGGLELLADGTVVRSLLGENLELDDGALAAVDTRTDVSADGSLVVDGVTDIDFAGGFTVDDDGDGSVTVATDSPWADPDDDGLVSLPGSDGIEVAQVRSPASEDLDLESDADLGLSISGADGAVTIETAGGHRVVLDDATESLALEDGAGNHVELHAGTGEVSISAATKLTLDAPVIELAAGSQLDVSSGGAMDIGSGGPMDVQGSILRLNGGGFPAARLGDIVTVQGAGGEATGTIVSGSSTVFTD